MGYVWIILMVLLFPTIALAQGSEKSLSTPDTTEQGVSHLKRHHPRGAEAGMNRLKTRGAQALLLADGQGRKDTLSQKQVRKQSNEHAHEHSQKPKNKYDLRDLGEPGRAGVHKHRPKEHGRGNAHAHRDHHDGEGHKHGDKHDDNGDHGQAVTGAHDDGHHGHGGHDHDGHGQDGEGGRHSHDHYDRAWDVGTMG